MSTSRTETRTPLVSVIVPTRNSAKTLETCLSSIRKQSYQNIELIVVDNNSTDGTKEIARKYTNLVFNLGPERNVQRPYGVSVAKGEHLLFIDSDMELPPHLIESALEKCKVEGHDAVILPEISVGNGFWADCKKLQKRCLLHDPYMELAWRFIKTDVYHAIGGLEETVVGPEDSFIHQALRRGGYRTGRIGDTILHHEGGSFKDMLRKYYVYGHSMHVYIRKYPKDGLKQYFIIRPAYVRNWGLFVKDPIHGLGLLIMNGFQYAAAAIGFLDLILKAAIKKGDHK